jgi:hypothetical protein
VALCYWLLLLSVIFSRSICIVVCIGTLFSWLNNISECVYTKVCVLIPPLMDLWAVPIVSLLWRILTWAFICKFLFEHLFSILLGVYLRVELLNHVGTCLIFWGLPSCFHCVCITFPPHQQEMSVPISPYSHQHLLLFVFIIATLVSVKWYLDVVPACTAYDIHVEHLSLCLLPICTLL